jgi:hypothetical protein
MLKLEIFSEKNWEEIENFPWMSEIESWENYHFIERRKGESRHTLFFLRTDKGDIVIKRTSSESAEKEFYVYKRLISMGIPTIVPIGFVKKQKNEAGEGYLLTLYEKGALPESHIMNLLKDKRYRDLVWNSVVALLAVMHLKGIFWGDPSLDNILIKFYKTKVEALLIDTETVKFYDYLSPQKEQEDLDRLFESLFAYSFTNNMVDEKMFEERKEYIFERYNKLKKLLSNEIEAGEEEYFKLIKRVDDLFLLGYTIKPERISPKLKIMFKPVTPRKGWFVQMLEDMLGVSFTPEQAKKIFKEILRHRYWMSKNEGQDVRIGEAARDWYQHRFLPAKRIFKQYFPGENPVKIYLEILDHKWFMSEKAGKDVGIIEAAKDYSKRFGKSENTSLWQNVIKLFSEVFRNK